MLATIKGMVLQKDGFIAVIEVHGLGFEVILSRSAFNRCTLGEEIYLLTSLQITEAGPSLYGFGDDLERRMFRLLLLVKGIGGRMAMTLLQALSPQEIISAVASGDGRSLTSVPGVGKKTAERICFELADKIEKQGLEELRTTPTKGDSIAGGVADALESLGFDRILALRTYKQLRETTSAAMTEEEAILNCLRLLQKK